LRPFGVSFIFGGYDVHDGFQLYQSDPSGNYAGWKATGKPISLARNPAISNSCSLSHSLIFLVVGANSNAAQSLLKTAYHDGCSLKEASLLATRVLKKTIGGATVLKPEKCTSSRHYFLWTLFAPALSTSNFNLFSGISAIDSRHRWSTHDETFIHP
jgi:hypothetical protein